MAKRKTKPETAQEEFLRRLMVARKDHTMESLAFELGVAQATISRWCRKAAKPSRLVVELCLPTLRELK